MFNRLHLHLDQRQDLEMAGLNTVDFRVARCENRQPAIDGADFTSDLVDSMYSRGVVVEIWGSLDASRTGGRFTPKAQMNYLLVPVMQDLGDQKTGIHRFNYPDSEILALDFVDLISNTDLHAFVAAGIGVMAFDDGDYTQAHTMLCMGAADLARTQRRLAANPQTARQSLQIKAVRDYLYDLAAQSIDEASGFDSPPRFAEFFQVGDPCSHGGTDQ
jgi:hypothetical protein